MKIRQIESINPLFSDRASGLPATKKIEPLQQDGPEPAPQFREKRRPKAKIPKLRHTSRHR